MCFVYTSGPCVRRRAAVQLMVPEVQGPTLQQDPRGVIVSLRRRSTCGVSVHSGRPPCCAAVHSCTLWAEIRPPLAKTSMFTSMPSRQRPRSLSFKGKLPPQNLQHVIICYRFHHVDNCVEMSDEAASHVHRLLSSGRSSSFEAHSPTASSSSWTWSPDRADVSVNNRPRSSARLRPSCMMNKRMKRCHRFKCTVDVLKYIYCALPFKSLGSHRNFVSMKITLN